MKISSFVYYNTPMLDIISTLSIYLLIFVEIFLTIFCVKKIQIFENKIDKIHVEMIEKATQILEVNDEIRKNLKKINKVIRILANKRFHQIRRIIMMTIDIVQLILLLKSLKLSKDLKKIDVGLLKKIAYAKIGQEVIRKFLDFAQSLCAV